MGLFEWFGESYNPGPMGDVKIGAGERPPRNGGERLIRFTLAVIFLVAALGGISYLVWPLTFKAVAIIFASTAAYLVASYFVRPRADTSNMGIAGGLIDHPFRWSDDVNRQLLFFQIILWPGRFVTDSVLDFLFSRE